MKSALTYPAVICVMAVVTIVILTAFVLPKFQTFFASFDAQLPLPTRILLTGAAFFQKWGLVIGGLGVLGAIALFVTLKSERGKFHRDRILLGLPVLGDIVRFATIERFFRILGAMLARRRTGARRDAGRERRLQQPRLLEGAPQRARGDAARRRTVDPAGRYRALSRRRGADAARRRGHRHPRAATRDSRPTSTSRS